MIVQRDIMRATANWKIWTGLWTGLWTGPWTGFYQVNNYLITNHFYLIINHPGIFLTLWTRFENAYFFLKEHRLKI